MKNSNLVYDLITTINITCFADSAGGGGGGSSDDDDDGTMHIAFSRHGYKVVVLPNGGLRGTGISQIVSGARDSVDYKQG